MKGEGKSEEKMKLSECSEFSLPFVLLIEGLDNSFTVRLAARDLG